MLQGRIRAPRPSPPIDLPNTVYVVLRAPGFETPLVCTRGADYRQVVGNFDRDTLSHGFPSVAEAKIYCAGAEVPYPTTIYQWRPWSILLPSRVASWTTTPSHGLWIQWVRTMLWWLSQWWWWSGRVACCLGSLLGSSLWRIFRQLQIWQKSLFLVLTIPSRFLQYSRRWSGCAGGPRRGGSGYRCRRCCFERNGRLQRAGRSIFLLCRRSSLGSITSGTPSSGKGLARGSGFNKGGLLLCGRRNDPCRRGGTRHTGGASVGSSRYYPLEEEACGKGRKGKGHDGIIGRADRIDEQPPSFNRFKVGSATAGAECDEGAVGSSGYCDPTSSQPTAGVYKPHSICKVDGFPTKSEASTSSANTFGHSDPGSTFHGSSYDSPGAGGGVPCSWGFNLGKGGTGAEQGIDYAGGSATNRWRPIVRLASVFLRDFTGIKGRRRQGKAASRAIEQIGQLLFGSYPECLEEDEAGFEAPNGFECCCCHGLLDGCLLRKVRWLRFMSRARPDSILLGSHLRLCSACRHGWSARTCGPHHHGSGTSSPGQQPVGACISVDFAGRPTKPIVELSAVKPQPSVEGICSPLSSKMGDHCTRLHERGGLHPEPQGRLGEEAASTTSCWGPLAQEEGERKQSKRCLRTEGGVDAEPMSWRSAPVGGPGAHDEFRLLEKDAIDFFGDGVAFSVWADGQVRRILASRSPFSYFCMRSIIGCRGGRYGASSTALFPIPLPYQKVWLSSRGRGKGDNEDRVYKKLLNMAILALNFEYLRHPLSCLSMLRRPPGPLHHRVYERLMRFIKASATTGTVSYLGCGRKKFQFGARINELVVALAKIGAASRLDYNRQEPLGLVPTDDTIAEELRPYRSLDPSWLVLTGEGDWQCEDFLSDLMWMVFMEPRVNCFDIRPPRHLVPDVKMEDKMKVYELSRLWDSHKLLQLCPVALLPSDLRLASRVFNNFKSKDADRQIGDRRGQNFKEGRIQGQSQFLPSAISLLQLSPVRHSELLVGAATDRKDFYHQFQVSFERATTNFMYPFFPAGELKELGAYKELVQDFGKKVRRSREAEGDFLAVRHSPLLLEDSTLVAPCFGSLFQGDHLGVEIACDAYSGMLQHYGLLHDRSRVWATRCLGSDLCVQGLYIDDFFSISRERVADYSAGKTAESTKVFWREKAAYKKEGILRSDAKDVVNALKFTIAGAEVDSSLRLVREGAVTCGLPADKRLALAMGASISAGLRCTSDALHASLVGSLASMLMFRRPAMSLLQEVFSVIPPTELNTTEPKLWPLRRSAAGELALVAALAPVLVSDLSSPVVPQLFATDASLKKGSIAAAEIPEDYAWLLWKDADKKGANLPLQSRNIAVTKQYDQSFEEGINLLGFSEVGDEIGGAYEDEVGIGSSSVHRPIGLYYDFLEICGGSGVATKELCRLGVNCGPILDITYSRHYNLTNRKVISWVIFLMEQGRLRSFLVAPPCTTFSPAAYPSLRSYRIPEGYDRSHPRARLGNCLAFAAILLLYVALRLKIMGLGEQPRRSKMRWLPHSQRLLALGATEAFLASCMYGSPHQKEFCFVGAGMRVELLSRRCSRDHDHVPIQGAFTKPSAVYCEGLAVALAVFFRDHLRALDLAAERLDLRSEGLEDQLSNDACLSLMWKEWAAWEWKGSSHVNILEAAATLKLYRDLAMRGGDVRSVYLGESHVARSALARGRTSSLALRPLLMQASSLSIAYGLYGAGRYAPTRWNPADHPTRDSSLPPPVPLSVTAGLTEDEILWLGALQKVRRWISNWVRFSLLLVPRLIGFSLPSSSRRHAHSWISPEEWGLDFDSTLGYPGEGPALSASPSGLDFWIFAVVSWISVFGGSKGKPQIFGVVTGHLITCSHGVTVPVVNPGDAVRQQARAGMKLEVGRPVTEGTRAVREDLFSQFCTWLGSTGVSFDEVFMANPPDLDTKNRILTEYGRMLFQIGKPYYHYAETLNCITARRAILRRSIGAAWDLAFMWRSHEPTEHHAAMPHQVLLGILSTCLVWGWLREAACFALAWGALLRIGEVVAATRRDIILPCDVQHSVSYLLLRIWEPKTRFKAARHQAGKLEQPDLILVVQLGFQHLQKHERLWPFSAATLRQRLNKVLQRLYLPWKADSKPRPLTLASFRAGGATWLISQSDSSELVRRRGRWISIQTMEIYIQEVMSLTYMTDIGEEAKDLVLTAMSHFLELLRTALKFNAFHLPPSTWAFLLKAGMT